MRKLPEINQLVVTNNEPGAVMWRVKTINSNARAVGVIDATIEDNHPNQRIQWIHLSMISAPSIGQLADFNS